FISAKKISDLQHYADKDDIKKILAVTKAEWNHIKASPLLLQIIESHIDIILTRYKGKKINELLSLYKIQKSDITDNLVSLLGNYISMPEIQAHLQKRITLRLEGFYISEKAKSILS
ncbi:MAG: hypothetical protein KA146_13345, partial [Leptospiraceae bacterium]|nr:hypothetical protein [Leptospiraceae bacterium]